MQINEARLRPCVGGLALFPGDQILEPKLTLTTFVFSSSGRRREKSEGGTGEEDGGRKWGGGRRGEEAALSSVPHPLPGKAKFRAFGG